MKVMNEVGVGNSTEDEIELQLPGGLQISGDI